jgi:GNAT superfamily N-acetyltransferase
MPDIHFTPEPFETEVLGFPVGRLVVPEGASLDALPNLEERWALEGYRLVSCRVREGWAEAGEALAGVGFDPIETLVRYERAPGAAPAMPPRVREGRAEDRDACEAIAVRSFRYDRFHREPSIPEGAADRLKARWVANGFAGRASSILVHDAGAGPIGFALGLAGEGAAVIDLIAVDPMFQGQGNGAALVKGFVARHADRLSRAATQADNMHACRLYERAGFAVAGRATTFHWVP